MPEEPLLSVVRGNPGPEDLAAIVTVLLTRGANRPSPEPTARFTTWTRSGRPSPGAMSWRESGLPR